MKRGLRGILGKTGKKSLLLVLLALLVTLSFSSAALVPVSRYDGEMEKYKIYLSPSVQNLNIYADKTTNEMEQCDKIAAATKTRLEEYGFDVMLGKSGDTIENRCAESDLYGANLHIPIHTNALNADYTGGTFVFVFSESEYEAAQCVLDKLAPLSPGDEDRIELQPKLYEVNMPAAETVYIECEFHDTEIGCEFIKNNTEAIAQAIADGVYEYFSEKQQSG